MGTVPIVTILVLNYQLCGVFECFRSGLQMRIQLHAQKLTVSKVDNETVWGQVGVPAVMVFNKTDLADPDQIDQVPPPTPPDPITANVYDEYKVGPSIRPIRTSWCFTMTNMIQVCRNFR